MNAHTTSTLAGDIAEVIAINNVFKDSQEIKMNGTKARNLKPTPHKTNSGISMRFSFTTLLGVTATYVLINRCFFFFQSMIGHCLGAAGGMEAIVTIKAITTGWLHPTINQDVILILVL